MRANDPTGSEIHQSQTVVTIGEPVEQASAAMILVHGRGASAENILGLTTELKADGFAFLAPQAAGNTWYPLSFLEPIESNEPHLSSAFSLLDSLIDSVEESGIPADRIILLGFSQGACLSCEYAARNARRYGGLVGLSGGLIGPDGTPRDYPGSLEGTPVFLGCSDVDFHIPVERVYESERVLRNLGGDVVANIYPGMGHTIIRDELDHVQSIIDRVLASR